MEVDRRPARASALVEEGGGQAARAAASPGISHGHQGALAPERRRARRGLRLAPHRGAPFGQYGLSRAKGADEIPRGKLGARLAEAAEAYAADRYHDALKLLRGIVAQVPGSAAVRELLGLTYYRMGRWRLAVRELEASHELSGGYEQFPVIADCYRAMGRYEEADAVWLELRRVSPGAEVVAEGRIVAAGALADRGDIAGAVRLLEPSLRRSKPAQHDLRQWYALADLYERAGDVPRAREVFSRVYAADPAAYDAGERLAALA